MHVGFKNTNTFRIRTDRTVPVQGRGTVSMDYRAVNIVSRWSRRVSNGHVSGNVT